MLKGAVKKVMLGLNVKKNIEEEQKEEFGGVGYVEHHFCDQHQESNPDCADCAGEDIDLDEEMKETIEAMKHQDLFKMLASRLDKIAHRFTIRHLKDCE